MQQSGILPKVEAWFKRKTGQDIALAATVLVFFVGLLPLAASFLIYFPHPERSYTDAALSMLQSHDFLTPKAADGSLRLWKPPFPYWLIVGSYQIAGVSAFSSRLVFLLAGCAIIPLGYALSLKLTGDQRAARMTALILLSNPILVLSSIRSMPDVLLAFSMLVSAYGFIQLICLDKVQSVSYWAAYGGAAIAIATKGLLPLAFVAYALVFAYFASSAEQPFRRVLSLKIISLSVLISCSWFVLMYWKHGNFFLRAFWYDQIGETIDAAGKKYPLPNSLLESNPFFRIGGYLMSYVVIFLPWLLCLGYGFHKHKSKTALATPQRRAGVFIVIWTLLLPIIFGLGPALSVRYLLPAFPLVAIALAICLCRFPQPSITIVTDQLLNIVTALLIALTILGLTILWQTDLVTNHFAGPAVLFLAILFVAIRLQKHHLSSPASFSFSFFLLIPLLAAVATPFTLPDQSAQIARALRMLNPTKTSVFLIGPVGLASRVRISTGGKYPVYQADSVDLLKKEPSVISRKFLLILRQSDAQHLPPNSFQLREIASGLDQISFPKMLKAIAKGETKSYLDSRKERYYAALPASIE